ncbi:MAG: mannosyltransferase family protein [Dehalococcoidia bacterium]|nr:mannosyltransferase family protein [Dehalococcoidia bacterium]
MGSLGEEVVLTAGAASGSRTVPVGVTRLGEIWAEIRTPVLVFLGLRVFLSLAVVLIYPLLPVSPNGVPWSALPDQPLLDVWAKWDSGWYANIALTGYHFSAERASNIAFLPLYPMAIKVLSLFVGNVWISGILVANAAFLGSLIVLFKLTRLKLGRAAADRTILYISAFPSAFFFLCMYSESIYLLTVLLTFYLWERNKGWPAGLFGGLAAIARPMGILLFLSGAARKLFEDRRTESRLVSWDSLSLLLIPLVLGVFLVYSYAAFGEPLAFLKSRELGWNEPLSLIPLSHRELFAALMDGTALSGGLQRLRLLDAASAVVFLAMVVPIFKKLGSTYGIYALGSVVMPLIVTLDGLMRYVLVIFPAFMIMGSWVPMKRIAVPLLVLSAMLTALLASMFARWYFVG